MLRKASWSDYLYLLFAGERPSERQSQLLDALALVLANPGPRDQSVRAAMNGGVGGSTSAASLMAALAVGAGGLGGSREIFYAVQWWERCGTDLEVWQKVLAGQSQNEDLDIWPMMEHPAGFDPHGIDCTKPVRQCLDYLASLCNDNALGFLKEYRKQLELIAKKPLALPGVAAAAIFDLGFNADQAEMLYLLLRLPGAAVHALEQKQNGWRKYPFFHNGVVLTDDPLQNEENTL